MQLKPSFLLAILFIVVSSLLAFDSSRAEEHEPKISSSEDVHDMRRGFENAREPSQIASACICGFTSFKCCYIKPMIREPKISSSEDVHDMRRGFENAREPSQIASACICGLTSFKCCYIKPMIREIMEARRNLAGVQKADIGDESINEWLQPEDLH